MILLPGPKFMTHMLDQNVRHRRFLCTFVSCSAILKNGRNTKGNIFYKDDEYGR